MKGRSRCFSCVIEYHDKLNGKVITKEDIRNYLDSCDNVIYYAFILHDRDIDDDGRLKTKHYHLVVQFQNLYSCKTIISDIAKTLCINILCVQVRACYDLCSAVRYLTHEFEKDIHKVRYGSYELCTNNAQETNLIFNFDTTLLSMDTNTIEHLCLTCKSITEVYIRIGLKASREYRNVIRDIWNEKHNLGV